MSLAPVALFIYARPQHVKRTLDGLSKCPEFAASEVFVFADGPRSPDDVTAVKAAREVVRATLGKRAHYRFSEINRGLSASIIAGVTELCDAFGKVIVVEDDLIVSPAFLRFLNAALDRYADDSEVMQVSGHMFPVAEFELRRDALFLPFTTSWGWATWARAWQDFDPAAAGWEVLKADSALRKRFDFGGAFCSTRLLQRQMRGELDSWAIRWYWSVFRRGGLVLFPPRTLVQNIGFDGSGTHGGYHLLGDVGTDGFSQGDCSVFPDRVTVLSDDYGSVQRVARSLSPTIANKVVGQIKRLWMMWSRG